MLGGIDVDVALLALASEEAGKAEQAEQTPGEVDIVVRLSAIDI